MKAETHFDTSTLKQLRREHGPLVFVKETY